jgi:septal ring factor EnvC (AmiA/AmiB activator)
MSNSSSGLRAPAVVVIALVAAGAALAISYFGFHKPTTTKLQGEITGLKGEVVKLTDIKQTLETSLASKTQEATTLTTNLTTANTQLTEIKARVANLESEVLSISQQKAKTEEEKVVLESKLADASALLKAAKAELARLGEENGELKGQVADLTSRITTAETLVSKLNTDLAQTRLALQTEQQARAQAETTARDTELQRMAESQRKVELSRQVQQLEARYAALTPVKLVQKRATQTGKGKAQAAGVPLGSVFDGIGDAIVGAGEAVAGRSGPPIWIAIMPDKTEVRVDDATADMWIKRGIPSEPLKP